MASDRYCFPLSFVVTIKHSRASLMTAIQAFFPANKDAWEKLERALKGTLDPEKFEALRGTVSLPFQPGKHNRVAVKVIDMRGNEVIRVLRVSGPER